ncbi:chorismate mutase [Streptococcus macacae]|uniref:Chorismate mutase n=1 Tax=Streptococcus macacae NCTC 11558 TaxID=764298 RepID=G5JYV4_9STRE|nr:chorismate mutase [Streptococcus macacae]EHJ52083.1 chorismate mutase [Streptococcus macacae NCTC 11558]SUN78211.1 putative mutase [Streptococcus macacae NCTC 11558]
MDLETIREQIDNIDKKLVQDLEQRMALVNQVAHYKKAAGKQVLDPKREQALLKKIAGLVDDDTYRSTISAIFTDILKHSREYQRRVLDEN